MDTFKSRITKVFPDYELGNPRMRSLTRPNQVKSIIYNRTILIVGYPNKPRDLPVYIFFHCLGSKTHYLKCAMEK